MKAMIAVLLGVFTFVSIVTGLTKLAVYFGAK